MNIKCKQPYLHTSRKKMLMIEKKIINLGMLMIEKKS